MKPDNDLIHQALTVDALAEAEKITGKSYKDDRDTAALGFMLHAEVGKEKREVLKRADDTYWSMPLDEYLRVVKDLGFELAYMEEFECKGKSDALYIFWHPEGVMLVFDTYYNKESINGGNFYYNWRSNPECDNHWQYTSSGSWNGPKSNYTNEEWDEARQKGEIFWTGDHDCREGLRFHFEQLRQNGVFLNPWKRRPFLHLTHWGDKGELSEGYSHEEYGKMANTKKVERIAKLPENVQIAITPEED